MLQGCTAERSHPPRRNAMPSQTRTNLKPHRKHLHHKVAADGSRRTLLALSSACCKSAVSSPISSSSQPPVASGLPQTIRLHPCDHCPIPPISPIIPICRRSRTRIQSWRKTVGNPKAVGAWCMRSDNRTEAMNLERFKDRFVSPAAAFIITTPDGDSRRMDGKPLTDYDRALLRGEKPMPEENMTPGKDASASEI